MAGTGEMAPDFSLPRDGGQTVTLSDLRGKMVVLFFYPKDDTPGCTTESIGFTAALPAFEAAGAQVFGVSRDSVKSHEAFAAKHDLGVPLLSDEDGKTCEDYGVWKEKKNYGRTYMGIVRTTVLIDAEGRVLQRWDNVRVPGHVDKVLEAVRQHAG